MLFEVEHALNITLDNNPDEGKFSERVEASSNDTNNTAGRISINL